MLEYKMNKQIESFSISPPIKLSEEGKWLLALTSSEATNNVFLKSEENNKFLVTTPACWFPPEAEETIDKLGNFLKFRSQIDIELYMKEFARRGLIENFFIWSSYF